MTEDDFRKLTELLALLNADDEGERANAWNALKRMTIDWKEVAACIEEAVKGQERGRKARWAAERQVHKQAEAIREAEMASLNAVMQEAFHAECERRGVTPDPAEEEMRFQKHFNPLDDRQALPQEWNKVRGVDPWLADDDPLWAEWEAQRIASAEAATRRKAKKEAEKAAQTARDAERQAAREVKWKAEFENLKAQRIAREGAARAPEAMFQAHARELAAQNAAKREWRDFGIKQAEWAYQDAQFAPAFEKLILCFKARARFSRADQKVLLDLFKRAHESKTQYTPLRAFRKMIKADELSHIDKMFEALQFRAADVSPAQAKG